MPLKEIELPVDDADLPGDVVAFLREADARVSRFLEDKPICGSGFVPSDFACVYRGLRAIANSRLAAGRAFCEWGSGYGVVASLAAMLGFDACGIEVDGELVDAARRLAADFQLRVEFVHGSFVPPGAEVDAEELFAQTADELSWMATDADSAYDELGLAPDDFDLIFAYPWPGEEALTDALFETYTANGALLLTHNKYRSLRLRRKAIRRPLRSRR